MIYTIRKGWHSCLHWFKIYTSLKNETYLVTFLTDPEYKLPEQDQGDINKLIGRSYGWNHHKDSVRVGWNYNRESNKYDLFSYSYFKGKRISRFIISANKNDELLVGFKSTTKDTVMLYVSNTTQEERAEVFFQAKSKYGYRLYPYFGGNQKAPKKFKIEIKAF